MKAAVLGEKGIEVRDLPKPEPKPNEVLIKVRASSLNRADITGRRRAIQHGPVGGVGARIGLECSGEVEAVGSEVKDFKPGDRVMASAPGGFAEYAVTDAGRAHRIPGNNMTYEQAACFPVALQTMHNAVVTAGRLKTRRDAADPGRQLRRRPDGHADRQADGRLAGLGTSTNAKRRARLKDYGCDVAIDTSEPDWPEEVKKATGGKGVNLIVDMVSAPRRHRQSRGVRRCSAASSMSAGSAAPRASSISTCMRSSASTISASPSAPARPRRCARSSRPMRADLWPAVEAGKLTLPIYKTFTLADIVEALSVMTANQHFGKIVISVA